MVQVGISSRGRGPEFMCISAVSKTGLMSKYVFCLAVHLNGATQELNSMVSCGWMKMRMAFLTNLKGALPHYYFFGWQIQVHLCEK
jgi:hypothetical protein